MWLPVCLYKESEIVKISKMTSQNSFCAPLVTAFANASRLSKLMFPVNILNVLFTNIVSSLRISFSFGVSLSWYSGCFLFAPLVFWCFSSSLLVSLSWYSGCFLFALLVFWCFSSFSANLSSGQLYSFQGTLF